MKSEDYKEKFIEEYKSHRFLPLNKIAEKAEVSILQVYLWMGKDADFRAKINSIADAQDGRLGA